LTVLLVRHTHAGDRSAWAGDDRRRPVSARGARQADALVKLLASYPIDRVLTSPYVRCVQSVAPLAAARGIEVEEEDVLAEGAPLDLVQQLLRRHAVDHTVLCSHGDVIGAIVTDLAERGVDLGPAGARWEKASTWVLDGDPLRPRASYLPPPA
jgi:broad specificity phosphatase PhoE